jgi:hypothetical protein
MKENQEYRLIEQAIKMIGLILALSVIFFSCSQNEEPAVRDSLSEAILRMEKADFEDGEKSQKIKIGTLSLTQDMFIDGNLVVLNELHLNGYELMVGGNFKSKTPLILDNGILHAFGRVFAPSIDLGNATIESGKNTRSFSYINTGNGVLTSEKSIKAYSIISGSGTLTYCNNIIAQTIDLSVTHNSNCK